MTMIKVTTQHYPLIHNAPVTVKTWNKVTPRNIYEASRVAYGHIASNTNVKTYKTLVIIDDGDDIVLSHLEIEQIAQRVVDYPWMERATDYLNKHYTPWAVAYNLTVRKR